MTTIVVNGPEPRAHPPDYRTAPDRPSRSGPDGGDAARIVELLQRRRLLVCVGSGGVGKTTTAAALGVAAARHGRRTAVLTIDPARRLRDALGISALGGAPHRVPLGRRPPGGSLDAMVLDTKRTFDELIERYAPTRAAAERVFTNRIYESVSTALAGAQEYMAMERLHALAGSGDYDLLVVDTPPTQHALDFLEAPERLIALLTSRAAAILQNPSVILAREGSRLAQAALGAVLRGLERFTGFELLRDVAEFVGGLEEFSAGFHERAASVARFLRAPETAFVLVTTPESARVAETLAFHRELVRAGLPFAGFVVNRALPPGLLDLPPFPDVEGADGADLALGRKLVTLHRRFTALVRAERAEIERLRSAAPDALAVEVPLTTEEPSSLARLVALSETFGPRR
ncbi:MAG: ArsA family ATPase [Deltaproteobacteria bacterium]|nr:ArsA family ATPase [Deltaproteobacteria bacterium]